MAQQLFICQTLQNITLHLKNFNLEFNVSKKIFTKTQICQNLKHFDFSLQYSKFDLKSLSEALFVFLANQKNLNSLYLEIKQNQLIQQEGQKMLLNLDNLQFLEKLVLNFNEPIQKSQFNSYDEFNLETKLASFLKEISINLRQVNINNSSLGTLFYQISQQNLLEKFSYVSLNSNKNSFVQLHDLLTNLTECSNLTQLEIQYKLQNIQQEQILLIGQQLSGLKNLELLIIDFDKYFQQEKLRVFKQIINSMQKLETLKILDLGIFFYFQSDDELLEQFQSIKNFKNMKTLSLNFEFDQDLNANELCLETISQCQLLETFNLSLKDQQYTSKVSDNVFFEQEFKCLNLKNLNLNLMQINNKLLFNISSINLCRTDVFQEDQCQILGSQISKCYNLQLLKIYAGQQFYLQMKNLFIGRGEGRAVSQLFSRPHLPAPARLFDKINILIKSFDSQMSSLFLSELVRCKNLQTLALQFRMEVQREDQASDVGIYLTQFQNLRNLTLEFFNNRMSVKFASKIAQYVSKCNQLIIFNFPQKQTLQHNKIIEILRNHISKAKRLTKLNCYYLNKGYLE